MDMKKVIVILMLSLCAFGISAQTNVERAEKLFSYVVSGMGDSVYACMNEKARTMMTAEMLSGLMQQLQPIYGRYTHHEDGGESGT